MLNFQFVLKMNQDAEEEVREGVEDVGGGQGQVLRGTALGRREGKELWMRELLRKRTA